VTDGINTLAYYGIKLNTALMEQFYLKNVNNGLNNNIYSYLETSGGKSCNMYLNVIHFLNASLNKISVAA
jgi:hypothetical protein